MADRIWIGADLGTQSVRVLAVDGAGTVLGRGTCPLTGRRNRAGHEQDPEEWWTAFTAASRAATEGLDATRIGGVAIDGTSGTVLLADAEGRPLTPGLMYDDARATAEALRVNETGAAVWDRLGYRRMQPGWALPKVLRLAERTTIPGGTRLLHQPDLITWRLAGRQLASDASHALKTGYDLVEERWPEDVLAQLGIPLALMPDVVRPGTVLGEVGTAGAAASGIPAGTPIVAGMTDGCAAQLAGGALSPGSWNAVLGTTLVLKGVSEHLVRDPGGVVYCHRGPAGTWLPGGASSSGAGALTRLLPGADLDKLTAEAATREPGPVVYPLAGERGERFPFAAADLEPFTLGEARDDADVFHGVLTGLACVERLCFDYLDHLGAPTGGTLAFTGGGSANRYWSQLRADLLGRPAVLPEHAESAVGMAVLAAATESSPVDAAAAMVRTGTEIEPDPSRHRALTGLYLDFIDHLHERGRIDRPFAAHVHRRAEH
ncbi:FGGY-family carbohydrate kinase [Glycomyces dulcitolivorans]|uniref:FGGY-family carbohydrate kinase n=1 Tax=Glycomyces dulcitolivorans TaxID=2200759 RepID=UPI000DD4E4E1|nr:FGGY family carbohydrate kinase [Glycomyces dulcitolivorans]